MAIKSSSGSTLKGPRIADRESINVASSKLAEARAELDAHYEEPWRKKVEAAVRGKDAVSTAALLDLLPLPATTGTARRVAAVMRSLHFIPIKSRRLMSVGHSQISSISTLIEASSWAAVLLGFFIVHFQASWLIRLNATGSGLPRRVCDLLASQHYQS